MTEQLQLDFSQSTTQRARTAEKQRDQLTLFASWAPNIDISLHSPTEAVAHIAGKDTDRGADWIRGLVGGGRALNRRRVAFPITRLDKLAWVRPPARITLDAATHAIACALHAHALGYKPLKIHKVGRRVAASNPRGWPAGLRVTDAPWTAVEALLNTDLPLTIEKEAEEAVAKRLEKSGSELAKATLSGNSILLQTGRPTLLEGRELPALSYVGEFGDGTYRMPLLLGDALLKDKTIKVDPKAEAAIKRATKPAKPLIIDDPSFPYTLYDFQSVDCGEGIKILKATGGVLFAGGMGTGKTTISLGVLHELNLWPALVVGPLASQSTWRRQFEEVGRSHYMATGSPRGDWEAIADGDYEAYFITFDRLEAFADLLATKNLRVIIADEIQKAKNAGSRRSRALRSLASAAPFRIGLSGTPLVGGLGDLLAQFSFLAPTEFPPRANKKTLEDRYPSEPVEALTDHVHSMMVRRRMDQVGKKMAKREDHEVFVNLTQEQQKAIRDLEEEARAAKEAGDLEGPDGRMNALVLLGRVRAVINNPRAAGIGGPNPKLNAALKLIKQAKKDGVRPVVFMQDRKSFGDLADMLNSEGISWGGINGSTPPPDRIEVEQRLHRKEIDAVLCSFAAAESWSASPTSTLCIIVSPTYSAAVNEQAESRVYRLNSNVSDTVRIIYLHAKNPSGEQSSDDRLFEILRMKKELFAKVIDRVEFEDVADISNNMSDLMYTLTGERDESLEVQEADQRRVGSEARRRKEHARRTLHGHKRGNRDDGDLVHDDGSVTEVLQTP